jgi:hemerythrin-like domain-containing protein
MCEHCGCRGVEPIAELMDEHFELLEIAGNIRRDLAAGDRPAAERGLLELGRRLEVHVEGEESGIFAALKAQGDFVDAVVDLEIEHVAFDSELEDLAPRDADFDERVVRLLQELSDHIDKENLGIFPVAVTTLGASGWDIIARARGPRSAAGRPSSTTSR